MEMRDRSTLEFSEKMCDYCCNFDKEHIGMDGTALCKLTMTLAYAEDYGGNCMFYNVPKERIIVPPCKVGETLYFLYDGTYANRPDLTPHIYKTNDWYFDIDKKGISILPRSIHSYKGKHHYYFGETVFLTKEEAENALKEREGNG